MEQTPHHREGIQSELDKAYDEAHHDNKAFDEAHAKIAEIKGTDIAHNEYGEIGDKEAHSEPSQERTLSFIRDAGYLDTSFEGKEVHRLTVEALTEEQALGNYRNSGGEVYHSVLQENFPYTRPEQEVLDVMIMKFDKIIRDSDDVISEMDKLGVRPLTYEELIQFGITYPENEQLLVALGSRHNHCAPRLWFAGTPTGQRLDTVDWVSRSEGDRFPVVRK